MDYLEPTSPVMALKWMTALDQCLGWVDRDGVRRIRWVRIDPLADVSGILVSMHEEDLAGDVRILERFGVPQLDPAVALSPDFVARDENEALLWAERQIGARRDRWVNESVERWAVLCELRGQF
ncbi:hypothetical protein [Actinoplanes sp. NPDC026670]|uniref:hypothetical protein n=1 Tax=Actinoplanes sp. NPDC026670 TaxID=3154700 RepID=UPI0033FD9DF6